MGWGRMEAGVGKLNGVGQQGGRAAGMAHACCTRTRVWRMHSASLAALGAQLSVWQLQRLLLLLLTAYNLTHTHTPVRSSARESGMEPSSASGSFRASATSCAASVVMSATSTSGWKARQVCSRGWYMSASQPVCAHVNDRGAGQQSDRVTGSAAVKRKAQGQRLLYAGDACGLAQRCRVELNCCVSCVRLCHWRAHSSDTHL